jgi:hypothetical protein
MIESHQMILWSEQPVDGSVPEFGIIKRRDGILEKLPVLDGLQSLCRPAYNTNMASP